MAALMSSRLRSIPSESTDTNSDWSAWTDAELLEAVRADQLDAYAELWRRHETIAARFARGLVSKCDVDDVVAESFAKTLRAICSGRGPEDNFQKYLMVTVRTTAFTFTSKRARAYSAASRFAPEETMPAPTHELNDDLLEQVFASLSSRWRKVLWWAVVEGLTAAEIAERLDLSPAAASALTYRARMALREAYFDAQLNSVA